MKISVVLFFIFGCFQSKAQINQNFINYLVLSDLHTEHATYLNSIEQDFGKTDSLSFYKSKFLLLTNQYDLFQQELSGCNLCFNDTSLLNYSASHLMKFSIEKTNKLWAIDSLKGKGITQASLLKKSYELTLNPKSDASFLPEDLQFHFNEFKTVNNKKAWVGGLLSAIIPASGKLYIGRTNSFLGAFLINVAHGIIAYEAISRKGINNPYSIVSTCVFGVFYLSNIFGTAHDLKRIRNEKRKHFLYEVADYQSADLFFYE